MRLLVSAWPTKDQIDDLFLGFADSLFGMGWTVVKVIGSFVVGDPQAGIVAAVSIVAFVVVMKIGAKD